MEYEGFKIESGINFWRRSCACSDTQIMFYEMTAVLGTYKSD